MVGRINGSSARAVEAIKGHGEAITDQLDRGVAWRYRALFGAQSEGIVGRISASGAEVLEAIRAHGNSVSHRLSEAGASAGNAVAAHTDDLVNRISTSSAEAAETLRTHGDMLAARLSEAAETINAHGDTVAVAARRGVRRDERRCQRVRGRGRRPRQCERSASR